MLKPKRGHNNKSHETKSLQHRIKNHEDLLVVPTDKTDSFRTVSKSNYFQWVADHQNVKEVHRGKLIKNQSTEKNGS